VIDAGANTMPIFSRPDLQPARSIVLGRAHPNPFRDQTTLRFDLPRGERVRLEVFDVMGRRVRVLAQGVLAAGTHEYSWDGLTETGMRVEAGIYVIRLEAAVVSTRRLVALVR
jgi:hypothetical protein